MILALKWAQKWPGSILLLLLHCYVSYAEKVPEKQFDSSPAHSVSHQSWQKPQLEPIQIWLAKLRGEVVDVPTRSKPSW